MAQGNHKLGKPKKSPGAQKRKVFKTVKKTKKGSSSVEKNKEILSTTKAINRKNERLVAAKALNSGTTFSLTDIAEKGTSFHIFIINSFVLRFHSVILSLIPHNTNMIILPDR